MRDSKTSKSVEMSRRVMSETGIFYPEWFWEQRLRFADILILVDKGQTKRVAKEIFQKFDSVLFTSWRINAIANLIIQVYYENSTELRDIIEGISAIDNVVKVEFSEYVSVVDRRSYPEVEKKIKEILGS